MQATVKMEKVEDCQYFSSLDQNFSRPAFIFFFLLVSLLPFSAVDDFFYTKKLDQFASTCRIRRKRFPCPRDIFLNNFF